MADYDDGTPNCKLWLNFPLVAKNLHHLSLESMDNYEEAVNELSASVNLRSLSLHGPAHT